MILGFRVPDVIIEEHKVSTSGKYLVFLGFHYEQGHTCWVVGSSNKVTNEVIMQHHNDRIPNCFAPEAQAKMKWEKFKELMTRRSDNEEEPSYLEDLQRYLN